MEKGGWCMCVSENSAYSAKAGLGPPVRLKPLTRGSRQKRRGRPREGRRPRPKEAIKAAGVADAMLPPTPASSAHRRGTAEHESHRRKVAGSTAPRAAAGAAKEAANSLCSGPGALPRASQSAQQQASQQSRTSTSWGGNVWQWMKGAGVAGLSLRRWLCTRSRRSSPVKGGRKWGGPHGG